MSLMFFTHGKPVQGLGEYSRLTSASWGIWGKSGFSRPAEEATQKGRDWLGRAFP